MSYDPGISGISGASDVFLNNPASNDALSYNTAAGKWENTPVDKTRVGLANVDNTSDVNKPVSTATQTALNLKAAASHTHAATDVTSGTFSIALLPAGSILYSEDAATRPTARTNIRVFFLTTADPTAVMITGDEWHRRA